MSKKYKILMISDHLLSTSGVGICSRYLAYGLVNTGKYQINQLGAAMRHEKHETLQPHPDIIIKPVEHFGTPEMLRQILVVDKPDALLLFTDPRFFMHIFGMEEEIHQICPILYWNIWDNFPAPEFNKPLYASVDALNCINQVAYTFCKEWFPEKTKYIPHAFPKELYFPLPEEEQKKWRHKILNGQADDHFVGIWVGRNAKRKCPGDMLMSWKMFLDDLEKKHGHRKATLIMHTDPYDQEGPNLLKVVEMLGIKNNVFFSNKRIEFENMNILHNIADFGLNVSCYPAGEFIVSESGFKPIEDIVVGERVLTHTGKYKPVKICSKRKLNNEPIYTIHSSNNPSIRITGEHPLWVIRKEKRDLLENNKKSYRQIGNHLDHFENFIEWVKVKDLKEGDYVIYKNRNLPEGDFVKQLDLYEFVKSDKSIRKGKGTEFNLYNADEQFVYFGSTKRGRIIGKRYIAIDEDLAFILGLWTADGSTHGTTITLNEYKEYELGEIYRKLVKKVFGKETFSKVDSRVGRLNITFEDETLYQKMFSSLCGFYSHGKYIPDFIMNSNNSIREAFLKGYFEGDGCELFNKHHNTMTNRIRTVSNKLAYDIKTLLIKLGYCPSLCQEDNSRGYGNGKIWCIEWRDRKNGDNGSCRSWLIGDKTLLMSRIFRISVEENQSCDVYNFEVEDDHSYANSAMISHNCAEGFGMPIVETMYCGKPVVVQKTGGLTKHVYDEKTGEEYGIGLEPDVFSLVGSQMVPYIFDTYVSHKKISDAFMKLYELGPEKRKELGLKGMKYVHEIYKLETMVKDWDESLTTTIETWKTNKSKLYQPWEMRTL